MVVITALVCPLATAWMATRGVGAPAVSTIAYRLAATPWRWAHAAS